MQIAKHASTFKVKTFSAASVSALDKQMNEWLEKNPSALILGTEFCSTFNPSYEKPFYAVHMTYQEGES